MPPPFARPEDADTRLDWSINALRDAEPAMSASITTTRAQRVGAVVALGVLVVTFVMAPSFTATVLLATLTFLYVCIVTMRWVLFLAGSRPGNIVTISDQEARALTDDELPVYTILLPAFREPGIVEDILAGIGKLDYPRHKLDVRLLLEADDDDTVQQAQSAPELTEWIRLELVPPAEPRTKPKACNWGLYDAQGEFVTIYDAEDTPEPLQLRRAVAAFRRLGSAYGCMQARLTYHNYGQNVLTRLFTIEYDTWFRSLLPGFAALGLPLPLGGTSNHLRTELVRDIHGWDPFNVTEDADLGVRINRLGFKTAVLDSDTIEEANSDAVNWLKQRSRWQKGYLQTGFVAFRKPLQIISQLGFWNALGFLVLVPGSTALAVLNGLLSMLTLTWLIDSPRWLTVVYPEWLLHLSLAVTAVGNCVGIHAHLCVMAESPRPKLTWWCLLLPAYWILITIAAIKASIQLITAPSYWEKTTHGLHRIQSAP